MRLTRIPEPKNNWVVTSWYKKYYCPVCKTTMTMRCCKLGMYCDGCNNWFVSTEVPGKTGTYVKGV